MEKTEIRSRAIVLLIGYALQFLAGMLLNLFVSIPAKHPGANGPEYFSASSHGLVWALSFSGGWELALHVYLALGLVIGSIILFIRCSNIKNKPWTYISGITAFFTLGAFFNGLSFIDYNHNFSSYIMAACWLIAVGSLVLGLLKYSTEAAVPSRKRR